jgi:aryl-alcohol dehydrogenase-like predicted oxidoreductase
MSAASQRGGTRAAGNPGWWLLAAVGEDGTANDLDREVRAVCRERGLGYTPFSPLAGGVLSGKYVRGKPFPDGTRMALRPEAHAEMMTDAVHDALDRVRSAAAARSVNCGGMALASVISHPDYTAPVVGPSRVAPHLDHLAEALKLVLTAEERAQIASWFEAAAA